MDWRSMVLLRSIHFVTLQRATKCYAFLRITVRCVSSVCGGSLSDGLWWASALSVRRPFVQALFVE